MKKALAFILSCMMATVAFAGCSSSPSATSSQEPAPASSAAASTAEASKEEAPAADPGVDISETVNLKMYFHGSNVTDGAPVVEKVNEYLKDKINATFDPIWGTWADFDTNVILSLNGGDPVDIYFTCSWSPDEYNAFAKKGYWVRLDAEENNLIEKYASDLWKMLPTVLTTIGAKTNGSDGYGVYAVPGYKDMATQNCWDINVPLLTKYGYTLDDIKNAGFYGFGDIMAKVKAGEGKSFYPLLVEGVVLERMVNNSIVVTGDMGNANLLSYYLDPANVSNDSPAGNKILSKFETPEYKKFAEKAREYYQAGYIDPAMGNPDTANSTRTAKQLTGEYLIGTQSYSLGYELQASQERKFEVAMVPTTDAYVDTTGTQGAMFAISTTSKNPDRAMMFLNLLNTDPALMTMVNYGIEGTHYELQDGLVKFLDKRADYIPWTNGVGNITILTPTVEQGPDFWTTFKNYYGAGKEIPILGYAFNPENVKNESAALANTYAEYALALSTGVVDPAVKLPEFIQKLKDNGLDKYVGEANSQLEAFLAAKG